MVGNKKIDWCNRCIGNDRVCAVGDLLPCDSCISDGSNINIMPSQFQAKEEVIKEKWCLRCIGNKRSVKKGSPAPCDICEKSIDFRIAPTLFERENTLVERENENDSLNGTAIKNLQKRFDGKVKAVPKEEPSRFAPMECSGCAYDKGDFGVRITEEPCFGCYPMADGMRSRFTPTLAPPECRGCFYDTGDHCGNPNWGEMRLEIMPSGKKGCFSTEGIGVQGPAEVKHDEDENLHLRMRIEELLEGEKVLKDVIVKQAIRLSRYE